MKKRFALITCAIALVLALPALAFAAPSPTTQTDYGTAKNPQTGATDLPVAVTSTYDKSLGSIVINPTDTQASNTALKDGETVVAQCEITTTSSLTPDQVQNAVVTINVGAENAGKAYRCFYEHHDGTTDIYSGTVASDGSTTQAPGKLSYATVAVGDAAEATTDSGAQSPKTGVDAGIIGFATLACAIAAGAVALGLRRKSDC